MVDLLTKHPKGVTYVLHKLPKIDGEYVKALRHKLGLSQWMFAWLMRVSTKTVEKWEQGKNPVTNGNIVAMILLDRNPELLSEFITVEEGVSTKPIGGPAKRSGESVEATPELKLANAK